MGMRQPSNESGMALIMVLWVISLMTIMAGSFALSTQREAGILSHAHERSKAVALADGGVNYAIMMLSLPDPTQRWRADGSHYVWDVGEGARVHITILDEGGKIDINAAQEQTLRSLFKLASMNDDQAAELTDRILDWRDPDDLKRANGAEAEDYQSNKMQAPPQNRNFLILDELRSVLGVTPDLYRKMETWFTLYTGMNGMNPAKASREVLLMLMGGDVSQVDSYIQLRRQIVQGAPAAPAPPPVAGIPYTGTSDLAYSITAAAEIQGQQGAGVVATVRRSPGAGGSPFSMLRWKTFGQPPHQHEHGGDDIKTDSRQGEPEP
jgi:general secretion pathway protein K